MGRVAMTCCMGRPATQSDVEEVYAAPPAPLAVPGATAGAVRKAGRSRRARIVIAALPVRAAEIARQARALQGAAPPAAAARAQGCPPPVTRTQRMETRRMPARRRRLRARPAPSTVGTSWSQAARARARGCAPWRSPRCVTWSASSCHLQRAATGGPCCKGGERQVLHPCARSGCLRPARPDGARRWARARAAASSASALPSSAVCAWPAAGVHLAQLQQTALPLQRPRLPRELGRTRCQGCADGASRAPRPLPACSASCCTGRCGRTSCPPDRAAGLSAGPRSRSLAPALCTPPSGRSRARARRARRAPAPCAAPGVSSHMPSYRESARATAVRL